MKSELEKYGIQMPAFSKIGGILANELSVDEAARERRSDGLGEGAGSERGSLPEPLPGFRAIKKHRF